MTSIIGKSLTRIDARAKVTGAAAYSGDLSMQGMAHAKILFARRPHARVKQIDLRAALALPGVLGIYTGQDVPNNEYGLVLFDAPVMVSAEVELRPNDVKIQNAMSKVFDGVVRHIGEKLAIIVAESEKIADHARSLIKVEYEDLPPTTDIHAAVAPDAYQIHPHYGGNVMKYYRVRKGAPIDEAFAQCDVVIEDTYTMGAQEHAYLQPEAGLAYFDEQGRLTIQVAGQWTHEDQEQIAHALKLPLDQVRVIYPAIGGAFGGREDMSVQIVLSLAAWKLRRPVKIVWTREESIIGHHKRHPMWFHAKLGAKRDGTLVAVQIDAISDAGPYAYTSTKVLGNVVETCTGAYVIPNVHVDARTVATHNVPSGAFRGFGAPQGLFVAETQMNKLAQALNMDPVELRRKNAWHDGCITLNNTPLPPGCSLNEVIDKCVSAASTSTGSVNASASSATSLAGSATSSASSATASASSATASASSATSLAGSVTASTTNKKIGRGFAIGHKNIGFSFGFPERCEATVELHGKEKIEGATVYYAGAECGQGTHTGVLQVAAHTLNLSPDQIKLELSDTSNSGSTGSASASRLMFMSAHAVMGAAQEALKKWRDEERPARAHFVYRPRATTTITDDTGEGDPNITYAYIAKHAEVEVDADTGNLRVRHLIIADDVGKAINPQQLVGQIEGGAVQGYGYAVLENFVTQGGYVKTNTFSTYLIPSVLDVPDRIESILVEHPDPHGAMGVRGMAELPLMLIAPVIVAAVHDATGVWINDLPLTPERVQKALKRAIA
jgi:CO/xanthine dehydrogenase Mo-binding subunit